MKSEKQKILITGCAGFIGSNLVGYFIDKGYAVVGLDNFETGFRHNLDDFLTIWNKMDKKKVVYQ